MPGYLAVDKNRTFRSDDIVAILTKRSKKGKSKIISRTDTYYSRTGSRILAERIEGEKEGNRPFKRKR